MRLGVRVLVLVAILGGCGKKPVEVPSVVAAPVAQEPSAPEAPPDPAIVTHKIITDWTNDLGTLIKSKQYVPAALKETPLDAWGNHLIYIRVSPSECSLCTAGPNGVYEEGDECATITAKGLDLTKDPVWSSEKRDALCAQAHKAWDERTLEAGPVLPSGFRAALSPDEAREFDKTCLARWLPELVRDVRDTDRSDAWAFAPEQWKFLADLSGSAQYQRNYERVLKRRDAANAKLEKEEQARREKEEQDSAARQEFGTAIGMVLRQNGFDGAVVGSTGLGNRTLFIQHEDFDRASASVLAAGLSDKAREYGFIVIKFSNGGLLGHKSWTFRVQ